MRNIKLILEYDGSEFSGFQLQPHHVTVQETLEKALSKFFNKPMKISSASGRTDAGVHARHQVVNFKTEREDDILQIQRGLNFHLPKTISVRKVEEVPARFHARFHAKGKTYEYCVWNDAARSPLLEKFANHIPYKLNLSKMRQAAKFFLGKHDFRSFCATGKPEDQKKDKVRTVKELL